MSAMTDKRKHYAVCKVADLPPGQRIIADLDGRSVGVFNVNGEFHALHNRCPHAAGTLCMGPVTGTTMPTEHGAREFVYGSEGHILRCAWHGWEFEIETGKCLIDAKVRAKTFKVSVENDQVVVHI